MDWNALRYWPKALGAALALALLLSLLSFHLQDPTFTNLRLPSGGIGNWLGLPGALLGGSLLECLGTAALAAPLLVLNWAWCARNRPSPLRYTGWSAGLLLALAGLHGLVVVPGDPALLGPGLAGWAVRRWAALTTGTWAAAALLAYIGAFAAVRVLYGPLARAALRDARVFGTWMLRESWRQWRDGWAAVRMRAARAQRVAGATALGLSRGTRLGLGGLRRMLLQPPRIALAWLAELRSPSLARVKARSMERTAQQPPRPRSAGRMAGKAAGQVAMADAEEAAASAFDAWFAPMDTEADVAEPPPAMPAAADRGRWATPPPRILGDDEELDRGFGGDDAAAITTPGLAAAQPEASLGAEAEPPAQDVPGYEFERPEAEAAWRERFQRYARNLDLDWEEQLWRRREEEARATREANTDPDA